MIVRKTAEFKLAHQANIERYCKILQTHLAAKSARLLSVADRIARHLAQTRARTTANDGCEQTEARMSIRLFGIPR